MEKHLHIISFTIPYPVDYGGVVDLFWKLSALHKQGIKIHLHCFDHGRSEQKELNKYCASVNYYKRNSFFTSIFSNKPFIVQSRSNKKLLNNLLKNDCQILCEGIHSTFLLSDKRFNNKNIYVRLHNVEHEYYQHLYHSTKNVFKKIFYKRESLLLKKYEQFVAKNASKILTVTKQDGLNYQTKFSSTNIKYLPLFLPENWQINIKVGLGDYSLYHGDLSVDANGKAVEWLLLNVTNKLLNIKFIVTGKRPSSNLIQLISKQKNVELVANPTEKTMYNLIRNAQINILPSFSSAGIKLKLLNALFNGRFCIANNDTISGSGLNELCTIANTPSEFIISIETLMSKDFLDEEIEKRKYTLTKKFNNQVNAELLIQYIFD